MTAQARTASGTEFGEEAAQDAEVRVHLRDSRTALRWRLGCSRLRTRTTPVRGSEDHTTASGVFQRRIHRLDPDSRTIRHQGLIFHLSACGAVAIATDHSVPEWEWCPTCWPTDPSLRDGTADR
ncbi:hypothetical protein [Saccharothrix violaceirubra]|uniref:Uncharacterized protein n=1 Tax=Saccharothrix violaceirubra TaxID=413306 RepID=A0A7W7WUL4_9PSEU|nr:hypothetical protein [Saccharothrix violaceirubra]MBB4963528.1 hypothetical protein [Saccharothrix violaceirubra]